MTEPIRAWAVKPVGWVVPDSETVSYCEGGAWRRACEIYDNPGRLSNAKRIKKLADEGFVAVRIEIREIAEGE